MSGWKWEGAECPHCKKEITIQVGGRYNHSVTCPECGKSIELNYKSIEEMRQDVNLFPDPKLCANVITADKKVIETMLNHPMCKK